MQTLISILRDNVSVISAVTALVAVLLSPLWTSRLAKKQILAPMRERWIDKLRGLVCEYISVIDHFELLRISPDRQVSDGELRDVSKQMLLLTSQIELMVNPTEHRHKELTSTLRDIRRLLFDLRREGRHDELKRLRKSAVAMSQGILKWEWDRLSKSWM